MIELVDNSQELSLLRRRYHQRLIKGCVPIILVLYCTEKYKRLGPLIGPALE